MLSWVKCFLLVQIVHGVVWKNAKGVKVLSMVEEKSEHGNGNKGAIPSGKRITILMRGAAFRAQFLKQRQGAKVDCDPRTREIQINGTMSLLQQVVEPFEARGNEVQIVSITHPCEFNAEIVSIIGDRAVVLEEISPVDQYDDFRKTLDIFSEHYGGVGAVSNEVDYILVVRHDLVWLQDITHWANDFDSFSFLHRCAPETGRNAGGENCVHDIVHWMPSNLFPVFDATVGHSWPFFDATVGHEWNFDCFVHDGHACFYPMQEALANYSSYANISFMSPLQIHTKHDNDLVTLSHIAIETTTTIAMIRDPTMTNTTTSITTSLWDSIWNFVRPRSLFSPS